MQQRPLRQSYLVSLSTSNPKQRTLMRNHLHRLGGREILPGLFWVALTTGERAALMRQFGDLRVRLQ